MYNQVGDVIVKNLRQQVLDYANKEWKTIPEYLFESSPDTAVLRHSRGKKWYGIIMNIPYAKLGIDRLGSSDILNLKCDPIISGELIMEKRAYPAYHMNKEKWISVLLDGSIPADDIYPLIELSYMLTSTKEKRKKQ